MWIGSNSQRSKPPKFLLQSNPIQSNQSYVVRSTLNSFELQPIWSKPSHPNFSFQVALPYVSANCKNTIRRYSESHRESCKGVKSKPSPTLIHCSIHTLFFSENKKTPPNSLFFFLSYHLLCFAFNNVFLALSSDSLKTLPDSSMELDLENPLTISHDVRSDTLTSLFSLESDHMPSETYFQTLQARDFDISIRREAIASISQVLILMRNEKKKTLKFALVCQFKNPETLFLLTLFSFYFMCFFWLLNLF